MMQIRDAVPTDREAVHDLHLSAFPVEERQIVATLGVDLLAGDGNLEIINLVAELDDKIVGHVAFSPVTIGNGNTQSGYLLAPLGVKPEYQKRGIGSALVEVGMKRLMTSGIDVLLVYGDPNYYGKFGFSADLASGYLPPYELQYPHGWLAIQYNTGVSPEPPQSISCVDALCNPELW